MSDILLSKILNDRRATRREFMVGATALGLSLTAASSMFNEARAATPKRGGTFTVGVHDSNTSDTFDTGAYQSVGEIQLAHAHRSYLTEITPENEASFHFHGARDALPVSAIVAMATSP